MAAHFDADEVCEAYTEMVDKPPSYAGLDPWEFYAPHEIHKRQQLWAERAAEDAAAMFGGYDDPDEEPGPFRFSEPLLQSVLTK
jgi:hypothetical protein